MKRTTVLKTVLAGSACALSLAWAAGATAQTRDFNVPAGDLKVALDAYARQSGGQILYRIDDVRGVRSGGARGALSSDAALERILAGSGFTVRRDAASGAAAVVKIGTEAAPVPQGGSAGPGAEPTAVDELIVTAQKKEERIQDVPIAISAFSQDSLEEQKIEGGYDLAKAVPNVTFSKSNYSGYNFSIRGVGTKAVSATSDPGVAISFNNVALIRNRLFEQEYFDVERVEVLRGPQGTLYGRNATGGVVNMITARPDFGVFEGSIKAEVGNFESRRLVGIVNVPLGDTLALRFAGSATERSGFAKNLTTGNDIDSRDLWSTRLSVSWEPVDRFRADFVWEHFDEDDSRQRTGKQLCHRDPGPTEIEGVAGTLDPLLQGRLSQGCKPGSLYSRDAFGTPNGLSIPFVVAGQYSAVLGWSGPDYLYDPANPTAWIPNPTAARVPLLRRGVDPFGAGQQPRDLRAIESAYDPEYRAKADVFMLNARFDLTDSLTLTYQGLYNEDEVYSFQDYHRFATVPTFNNSMGLYTTDNWGTPLEYQQPARFVNLTPGGVYTDPQIGAADRLMGFEISSSESTQIAHELRLQSAFDGPINFSVGANYTKFEGLNDYFLFYNVVTAIAQVQYNKSATYEGCNNGDTCVKIDPNPIGSLTGDGHNYFRNQNPYELESRAIFGEVYWQASPELKITAGLRYTDDRKQLTPWRSQLMVPGMDYGPSDPIKQQWQEATGRLGFDWKPALSFTDDTMVYGFYSRGYKAGGSNPPPADLYQDMPLPVDHPVTFDPEFVNAFEVGAKNTLLGGSLILNLSAFHYDYEGYQVSKVVDRTVVNENFDAKMWGAEIETIWRPTPQLRLNASLGYLRTRIGDGEKSIDIFDRTQGNPGWMVVTPWLQQTSNCILPTNVVAGLANMGLVPGDFAHVSPIMAACLGYIIHAEDPTNGYFPIFGFNPDEHPEINNGTGFFADLSGNELPNAPKWTLALGAEYSWSFGDGEWEATLRGDYYRQTDSWSRVYNTVADRLEGWDNANVSLRISRPADDLTFEIYAKNVFDDTPITDAFLNSDSTGMTTNIFTLDPRLIGVSVTKGF